MNDKERNDAIDYIVKKNKLQLSIDGQHINRKYIEKYRNHLNLMLNKQLDKESADYRKKIIKLSDEELKASLKEIEEDELLLYEYSSNSICDDPCKDPYYGYDYPDDYDDGSNNSSLKKEDLDAIADDLFE